jgi:hypothetical protein
VQLLPSNELRGLTARTEISYDTSIEFSLSPAQLIGLLVPDVFGRGPGSYWGPWPRVEMGYFGVLPLLAATIALAVRRSPKVWLIAGIGLFGVILAFGGYTVVHGLFYRFVPGFQSIRAPARAILMFQLAAAWLAAIGIDAAMSSIGILDLSRIGKTVRWLGVGLFAIVAGSLPLMILFLAAVRNQPGPLTIRIMPIVDGIVLFVVLAGLTLLLFGLRSKSILPAALFGVLALGLTSFDMLTAAFDVEGGPQDPGENYSHPAVVGFLRQDTETYRIDSETGVWDSWQPATGLFQRIPEIRGVDNPLMIADVQRYWAELGGRIGAPYDLLNVRYVLGHPDIKLEADKFEKVFDQDPEIAVFRNRRFLSFATIVPSATTADHEGAFAAVHRQGFDPYGTVVIEDTAAAPGGPGTVTVETSNPGFLRLKASAPQGGYLLLSQTFYPGWTATVDGAQSRLYRANYLFQAVRLEPGEHTVEIAFRPLSTAIGGAISALTLLTLVAVNIAIYSRNRHSRMAVELLQV